MTLTIHTDGGARGNPGPAAIGVVIATDDHVVSTISEYIGSATNNIAEYEAVLRALEWIYTNIEELRVTYKEMEFFLDSLLVVNQLQGVYKIKNPELAKKATNIHALLKNIAVPCRFRHIPRAQNKLADALVNKALDEYRA